LLNITVKPFIQFFLEYRQGLAKDLSIHANNKKGGNIMKDTPLAKGPRRKNHKNGDVLIGDELVKELGALNGVEFEEGKEVTRKNTNPPQKLKMFTNLHGQQCGKIIEVK
jgi:hypothetical protein